MARLPADVLKNTAPVHRVLPPEGQAMLQRAAATPTPPGDPMARTRAINQAVEKLKFLYPEVFELEK